MIDITKFMEVFIITNGRESSKYVIKSLEKQKGVKFNLKIIRNKKWLDACNECLYNSETPYYLRLDDDMIIHHQTVNYFQYLVKKKEVDNGILYCTKLWEPWNKRLCNKVKVYNRKLTKEIGFEIDSRGKVDKIFKRKLLEKGYKIIGDKISAIGIHAACKADDNFKYSKLRNETNDPTFEIRRKEIIFLDKVSKKIPVKKQFEMANKDLYEFNKKTNTLFYKFIDSHGGN